jgi:hypothetical protein
MAEASSPIDCVEANADAASRQSGLPLATEAALAHDLALLTSCRVHVPRCEDGVALEPLRGVPNEAA